VKINKEALLKASSNALWYYEFRGCAYVET